MRLSEQVKVTDINGVAYHTAEFIKTAKGPWACIIELIMAVICAIRNKLDCLPLNTRLGWKGLTGTNNLAYYGNCKLRP
jgi:hypothetical protein